MELGSPNKLKTLVIDLLWFLKAGMIVVGEPTVDFQPTTRGISTKFLPVNLARSDAYPALGKVFIHKEFSFADKKTKEKFLDKLPFCTTQMVDEVLPDCYVQFIQPGTGKRTVN